MISNVLGASDTRHTHNYSPSRKEQTQIVQEKLAKVNHIIDAFSGPAMPHF
jgi:hypothetical protein